MGGGKVSSSTTSISPLLPTYLAALVAGNRSHGPVGFAGKDSLSSKPLSPLYMPGFRSQERSCLQTSRSRRLELVEIFSRPSEDQTSLSLCLSHDGRQSLLSNLRITSTLPEETCTYIINSLWVRSTTSPPAPRLWIGDKTSCPSTSSLVCSQPLFPQSSCWR